jgi:alkylated DNA repair protein (DNA oxidative demethylase)
VEDAEGLPVIQDLFENEARDVSLASGAVVLGGFARRLEGPLMVALQRVVQRAPFRHMITPGGHRMSIAMTSCGTAGWVTDRTGYRYDGRDSGERAPLAVDARGVRGAGARGGGPAGFDAFEPDSCLVNRYEPGGRLTLHQDRNERDFEAPIVSVSLGLPAVFLFGGLRRADTPLRVRLTHGDVVVWGGPARLRYHGVLPLKPGYHPVVGGRRINLTFRKAT